MAVQGLWPREAPRPGSSYAEAAVWKALRTGLPKGWTAWHSLRLRDGSSWLGEGDFVVADPRRGVLVLEVKGGDITVHDGRWFSRSQPLDKPPLHQALGFVKLLQRRLAAHSCQAPAIGAAVCFPDTEFERPPGEDMLAGVVVGKAQLPWIGEALPTLFERAIAPRVDEVGSWIDRIHDFWGETWVPALTLGMRANALGEDRFALTEAQLDVLDGLAENERVLVQGGAGSGKTLLAAEAARREAAAGRRVLLLCFTRPLQRWLQRRLAGTGVEVHTVSEFAWSTVHDAGATTAPADSTDSAHWRETLLAAGDRATPDWDSVLVDEAQDLQEEAWLLVSALTPAGKRLWAFHDPGQAFWPERTPPADVFAGATRYKLRAGKRCPPGIQAFASRWLGESFDSAALKAAWDERVLGAVESPSPTAVADKIGAEVDRMLSEGLSPGDIGIVSLRGQTAKDAIFMREKIGRHEFVRADAPDASEKLVADSFLRWKGLERPAVIVTDLPAPGTELKQLGVRMYVALTRAMVCARLAGTRVQVEAIRG
ncbi:nuclease-related domain-containing DEAD/DEAH box helicase [Anaeromyxobacter sp. SG66]|uniref:nuclease-related domain-containing DEAD/DEAH box helicase n=1 Tax=Anaeromyxobacter sp. SG66 TaxID=2925410 RepID=UPI001F5791EF|nr:nuclease-related domain-containing DEAD/DEAH box helicase [Anaeromyxobacter sp. SG66]